MGFFRRAVDKLSPARGRGRTGGATTRTVDLEVANHLSEFVRTRRGVEAFVEPQTIVTQTTVLLVAWDGEWTRRRVPSPQWAYSFAEHLQIPGYDALVIGYPQRMRDYNTRLSRKVDGPLPNGTAARTSAERADPSSLDRSDVLSEDEFRQPPGSTPGPRPDPGPPSDLR